MQKLESSLKNMVLVLVGVALIVGAVLAYINHLTSGPIAEKAAQSLAAGIKSVMGTEDLQVAEPEEGWSFHDECERFIVVHSDHDRNWQANFKFLCSSIEFFTECHDVYTTLT